MTTTIKEKTINYIPWFVKVGIIVKNVRKNKSLSDPDKSVDLNSLASAIHSKLPKYARPIFLRRMTKVTWW